MKIVRRDTAQVAAKIDGLYQCYPSTENNRGTAVRFSTVEKAAAYLCENPEWGIVMNPGETIVYRDIVIERDG